MSNFARINKNSIISLSTNDNTSSVKNKNKRMDDADLRRIQRRLADKVGAKSKNKAKDHRSTKDVAKYPPNILEEDYSKLAEAACSDRPKKAR